MDAPSQCFCLASQCDVAFVGFGEVNSPRELIEQKCRDACRALSESGIKACAIGPVSDDAERKDVLCAIEGLRAQSFDCIVVCLAGWIPSHAVVNVLSEFKHIPMVLWGLAGQYEGRRLVTTAAQAGTSALRKAMVDLGFRFTFVYDVPGLPPRAEAIKTQICAVRAAKLVRHSRVGMMGYRDMGLYATVFDAITLRRDLGVDVEFFEMLEMVQRAERVDAGQVESLVRRMASKWDLGTAAPNALERSARYFLALKEIITERKFTAVSLIDVDGMKKLLGLPPATIFMLIDEELQLPTIPENDTLGAVTQLIVRALTGQAAAYFEFYEFMEDRVLIGVPDYVPAEVVEGRVRVTPTRFGNLGEGLLNVSEVKIGRVTLSRLLQTERGYALHVVTGTAISARPWEEAGWQQPAPQLPGLEILLDMPVDLFAEKVGGQHYILSYGDASAVLKAFSKFTGIGFV